MKQIIWRDKDFQLKKEWLEFKMAHYQEVFGEHWRDVFMLSKPRPDEELLTVEFYGEIAGKCYCSKTNNGLKIRDYTVLPKFRGNGIGRDILEEMEYKARREGLDYLVSFPYLIPVTREERKHERFEMSQFYVKTGFTPTLFDMDELDQEEGTAVTIYLILNSEYQKQLRVFRKRLNPVTLRDEVKEELSKLTPRQKEIVLNGLNAKLGAYQKTKHLSYKYSVCPVCKDIGSTLENPNCEECYIPITCKEPFNKGFRYDDIAGVIYFSKVGDFIQSHKDSL